MVEAFKTNIESHEEAKRIRKLLLVLFPNSQINVDIEDCDKVLRIEGEFCSKTIIALVRASDFQCEILE
jgi:hypothetical protein